MTEVEDIVLKLRAAYGYARYFSDDPNTQNGALLVSPYDNLQPHGANCLPEGVARTPDRLQRPTKYQYIEHAERAAIFEAARLGVMTKDATLYVPWYACTDCARAIIAAGIIRVIGHWDVMEKTPDHWKENIETANQMLDEAGVIRDYFRGQLFRPEENFQILFNGTLWTP